MQASSHKQYTPAPPFGVTALLLAHVQCYSPATCLHDCHIPVCAGVVHLCMHLLCLSAKHLASHSRLFVLFLSSGIVMRRNIYTCSGACQAQQCQVVVSPLVHVCAMIQYHNAMARGSFIMYVMSQ